MTSEQLLAEIFHTYSNLSGGCCVQHATFNDHMLNRFWPEYQKLMLAKPVVNHPEPFPLKPEPTP